MVETLAAAGVIAIVGSLWRLSVGHSELSSTIKHGLEAVLLEFKGLRHDLKKDIDRAEEILDDHEHRIRRLEQEP